MENFIFCFLCSVAFFQIVLPRRLTSLVLVMVFSRLRKFNAQTKTFDTISCLSCSPQYLHIVKYLFLFFWYHTQLCLCLFIQTRFHVHCLISASFSTIFLQWLLTNHSCGYQTDHRVRKIFQQSACVSTFVP